MSLTGGTKDVNPQWLTFRAAQSGADTTTTTQQNIPIQRLNNRNRAMVLEVLKVWFTWLAPTKVDASQMRCYLTTKNFGTGAISSNETSVFAFVEFYTNFTTSGQVNNIFPVCLDLTDGAGHGVLVATDAMYAEVVSASTSATNTVDIKILYRWKDVSITEYVGIVQSQQ